MAKDTTRIDTLCINTLRILAADAVEKAKSGHPGAPMGLAPTAYVLWSRFLKHNPKNTGWADRDRFVLSAGHASMMLYGLLHLSGYDIKIKDIQNFRQWGSITPGHPEYGVTPGVETTTGPLGQGFANAVGMAMAERFMAHYFNRPNYRLVDHYTYVIAGDGDMMEGISYEAASLAGHHKLGKLICLYDDNHVTIDGTTDLAFSEDVAKRFEAAGWHVQRVADGDHDVTAIGKAIERARKETQKPSIVMIRTTIGYGSPNKSESHTSHGAPLGEEEVRLAKKTLDWPEKEHFMVPDQVREIFTRAADRGRKAESEWNERIDRYRRAYPELIGRFRAFMNRELPRGWDKHLPHFKPQDGPVATRSASNKCLNALAKVLPNFLSGSADLTESVGTLLKGMGEMGIGQPMGRNVCYGVREHAMGAIVNGMVVHGGVIPAAGTFLIFSDYMKPPLRMAALMKIPSIFIFSHDSIGVGEDGPTHQPVEQLATLRSVPSLTVIRPADANETAGAWCAALERQDGPTALVLTRQKIPVLPQAAADPVASVARGGYVIDKESKGRPDVILIATGSEVALALEAKKVLKDRKISVRVVSMPSWELFEAQDEAYREKVLPSDVRKRVVIEMASSMGWHRYAGLDGVYVTVDGFGASAPGKVVMEKYGFTVDNIVAKTLKLVKSSNKKRR